MYKNFIKRLIDIITSFTGLVLLSPVLIITAILIAFANKGTPFFYQTRPGKHQKAFKIIKFKSMTDAKDARGNLLPDNERITRVGKFIRKTSVDELPQLINVLSGDMSLVGPRPLLFKYIPLYNEQQLRRHEMRPGITGWAQVNGRNSISWTDKFKLDVYYVDNVSLWLDIKILWMTAIKVIQRKDINQSDNRPIQPFNGTN
ncbi:lipid carrier--UDP-N-acetylgalactosaminyltransferase [Flavobacterium cyanobacteriorum]|uniref:Lipid carrier--UDP-N-acetylgalactosaminyltransferase n=1 Tax=Flavobacterium cyanobacteriorum TaxID=2022802 RepID=A0A255YSE4_9FLAO|nr:sugar transferase [Flavobacterium cyanobacteriorum]OYQ32119.1 lipid carrier--UDP-N-acetylgalactosaminyltransferase [Flavobacterium cyanobacteriorum]